MIQFGRYELFESLGRGEFGMVYRAQDTQSNMERAVKLLHPPLVADPEFIARFRMEAQIAARLDHLNIVPVYDMGKIEGKFYLAMKLLPGGSLKERLTKEGRLPYPEGEMG
jgi:serine/threonine protein kinase